MVGAPGRRFTNYCVAPSLADTNAGAQVRWATEPGVWVSPSYSTSKSSPSRAAGYRQAHPSKPCSFGISPGKSALSSPKYFPSPIAVGGQGSPTPPSCRRSGARQSQPAAPISYVLSVLTYRPQSAPPSVIRSVSNGEPRAHILHFRGLRYSNSPRERPTARQLRGLLRSPLGLHASCKASVLPSHCPSL